MRPVSSNLWSTVKVRDLPPIQVRARPPPLSSSSPPVGRTRQDECGSKKRAATSPPQSESSAKDPRIHKDTPCEVVHLNLSVEEPCGVASEVKEIGEVGGVHTASNTKTNIAEKALSFLNSEPSTLNPSRVRRNSLNF